MKNDRATVMRWMLQQGATVPQTAKRFGLPKTTIQAWDKGKRAPPPPRGNLKKPRPPEDAQPPASVLDMSPRQANEWLIAEVVRVRDDSHEAESYTASARMTAELVKLVRDIRPDEAPEIDEVNMPREEYEARLIEGAEGMSDRDIELIMQVYGERHRGRILFVGEAGHKAELQNAIWQIEGKES